MQKLPLSWASIEALVFLLAVSGCVSVGHSYPSAKWAMDDSQYAQEHGTPESANPSVRRAQRRWDMTDASFQEGRDGAYIGGGSTIHGRPAATGSTGLLKMPTSWSTVRYGVFGMDERGIGVGGVEGGVRIHAPTRFTPYVGLSGDAGFSSLHTGISHNNNNSTRTPRSGQIVAKANGLLAVVPEAGVSYWVNSSTRLNAGASYYVASGGPDFLVFGLSMEFLSRDGSILNSVFPAQSNASLPNGADGTGQPSQLEDGFIPYFVGREEVTGPPISHHARRAKTNRSIEERSNDIGSVPTPEIDTLGMKSELNDLPEPIVTSSILFVPDSSPTNVEQRHSM